MMNRPVPSTLAEAVAAGCDTVQFNYDGMHVQFSAAKGKLHTYTLQLKPASDPLDIADAVLNCTLMGTYVPHADLRYVFDCWYIENGDGYIDLRAEPYRSRYVAAKIQCQIIGSKLILVQSFPISKAHDLWSLLPMTDHTKGLIFRDSRENIYDTVRVQRWYREAPAELR